MAGDGVTTIAGFDNGAVVVAGERGSGKFVAIADPSILINKMLLFRGNVQLATNMRFEEEYSRKLRPYAAITATRHSRYGAGYSLRLGVATSIFATHCGHTQRLMDQPVQQGLGKNCY